MIQVRDAMYKEMETIINQRLIAYEMYKDVLPQPHYEALINAITSNKEELKEEELIVALSDGFIVGSVALFPPSSDAYNGHLNQLEFPEIRMLAVSSNARNKGVGEVLVQECIRRSKRKGYSYIGLHTGDFMTGAMKLYEKLGFYRVPELDFEPANDGIIVKAYRLKIE